MTNRDSGDSKVGSDGGACNANCYADAPVSTAPDADGDGGDGNDAPAPGPPCATLERVSISALGEQSNGDTAEVALSGDGRFVAFESAATNLVPNDTNGASDIFVFDRLTKSIERVSTASDGTQANAESLGVSISDDGRWVAFTSSATNLVATPSSKRGAFVHDRTSHTTMRVSLDSSGMPVETYSAMLSASGNRVLFGSPSALVATDTNGVVDAYVRDLAAATTIRVSEVDSPSPPVLIVANQLSGNGEVATFTKQSVDENTGRTRYDFFARDLVSGATEHVITNDAPPTTTQAAVDSTGRRLAVVVPSSLVAGDTNHHDDLYVRDRTAQSWQRISDDTFASSALSIGPIAMDGAGERIVLRRFATALPATVYLHDAVDDTMTVVSKRLDGTPATPTRSVAISSNGKCVAFTSGDANITGGDTNWVDDVFVGPAR